MSAERLMLIGFDGAMPEHLESSVAEGVMPNVAELMKKNGAYARALTCPSSAAGSSEKTGKETKHD